MVLAIDRPWIDAGLKIARISRFDLPTLLVQRVARLRAQPGYSQRALYCELLEPRFVAHIKAVTTGANVPHISGPDILRHQVPLAPEPLLQRFTDLVEPMFALSDRLLEQKRRLVAARDLLLPRLISGEIDVSSLPEPPG